MDKARLHDKLDQFWFYYIKELNFNIPEHVIRFKIQQQTGSIITLVDIIFSEVSAFYYVNDQGENRLRNAKLMPGRLQEFTSVSWHEEGVGLIELRPLPAEENWASGWLSTANFSVEMDPSHLLIEAKCITIDDETFEVGIPKKFARSDNI